VLGDGGPGVSPGQAEALATLRNIKNAEYSKAIEDNMGGAIFLIQDNGHLMEMNEQDYDSEDLLQGLLAKYPNILAGDQINSIEPRRWLLIAREASLPSEEDGAGRWSVDHLFLDQDAIPTLVEVKRSKDTRIRREVVGQMLDYAANAVVYWPVERIRAQFEVTCQSQGREGEKALAEFLGPAADPEEYWQKMKTNLQAGKVRMVFVADKIPVELQRIVEFLNVQMDPAEVLALEVKQFLGQGLKTLVPRVIGQMAMDKPERGREARQWDEASFFLDLESRRGIEESKIAREILEWAKARNLRIWWGKGKIYGSFFPMFDYQGNSYFLMSVWTYGTIEVQFQMMKNKSPFDNEDKRLELLQRLNEISGISFPSDAINRRPSLGLSTLEDEAVLKKFLNTFDWVIQEIKSSPDL
jgi:hypothetical protein